MTYYTILCGSWKDARGVQRLGETDSRKEAEQIAHEAADRLGEVVTVLYERPRAGWGMVGGSFRIYPTARKEA